MNHHFEYHGELESFEEMIPFFAVMGSVILVAMIIALLVNVVMWVFRSLPVYTIAKRRGLRNPWLAWIPVGSEWIIGSVSDQYQYLTQGKNRNRRKILLILSLTAMVLGWISAGWGISRVLSVFFTYGGYAPPKAFVEVMLPMTGTMLLGFVSFGVGVAAFVFRQISMYDLYRSCDPKNAIPYLVLSILFPILEPVFLMILRNRDDGMPPRKTAAEEPAGEYL